MRLGDIEALSHGSFSIDRRYFASDGDVYLVARPLAGREFRSDAFVVRTGRAAVCMIENQRGLSHVVLR